MCKSNTLAKIFEIKYPEGLLCPVCGAPITSETMNSPSRIRCTKCWHSFSLLKGSFIENSHLPIEQWDKLFLAVAAQSNLKEIKTAIEKIGSPPTCSHCLHKLSHLLERTCPMLSGTIEVEIIDFPPVMCLQDEKHQFILALVMAENHLEGKIIVHLMTQRDAEVICSEIATRVKPESIVRTNCFLIYNLLNARGLKAEILLSAPRMFDTLVTVTPLFQSCRIGLAKLVQWLGDDWSNLPFKTLQLYLPFFNFHSAMKFENLEKAYDFLLKAAFTTHKARLQQNG